jgi:hypothetical protein
MLKINMIGVMLAACLAQPANGASLAVKNQNCVYQGLKRTNEVKIRILHTKHILRTEFQGPVDKLADQCTDEWLTIHVGSTRTVAVVDYFDNHSDVYTGKKVGPALECFYSVQAEGVVGGDQNVSGTKDQKFTCKTDWAGVCQCRNQ